MPPKAKTASAETSAEPKFDMTPNDLKLLRAMVIHMEGPPTIDYESLRQEVGYAHTKNAKSAIKNLLEKMKRQANAAATEKGADKAATPEADGSDDEQSEESAKKSPVKKSARAKKGKLPEKVVDDGSEEEVSAKKVATKTPAGKKKAPAKKGVGKTTTPKKASAGGPKPAVKGKGKGKKATKAEEEDVQKEEDAEVEAEDDDAAKEEDEDEEDMKVDDTGKSPDSLPAPPTPSAGKSVATQTLPATAVMTGPPLYIDINGEVYTYTPYDVHVAQSHGVTLERYLEWKKDNLKYDDYLDPVPYSL